MKQLQLLLISLYALCLLNACGGGSSGLTPPPAATHLSVTAPATATVGTAVSVTVTALDASNHTVTTYSGAVHFTSTDAQAVLPAKSSLANGTATFPATLNTTGSQTITASDATTLSLGGTSNSINVSGGHGKASPVPLINQALSPDATIPGGAAFKLTLHGTGFVPGSTVKWKGSARATTFVSDSQVTTTILASDIASAQTASVTVVNPGGGISNVAFFETTNPTSFASWSAPSILATGANPSSVATADFNGDGKLDMVVTNGGGTDINILLGNGDGTFQAAVAYPAGTDPESVAVGDFNGDGKLDLAVANAASGNVSIFLGNGDGTFRAAVNYPAGTNPDSIAVGDFKGDGKLDLAVANAASGNVSILIGNGDGTFQTAMDYAVGSHPTSVAVGDFNGDGKLDLAVANFDYVVGSVGILLGNGDGTFQAAVNYTTGPRSSSVALGDFNGDGKLDLAVAIGGQGNFGNGGVSVLLGNGDGTFQAAVNYPTIWNNLFVAVGDFNGDGKLDLAVASSCVACGAPIPSSVSVFLGNGDGTFQPATDHAAGITPSSIAVGDFNGDGRLDLAVTEQSAVSVLLYPVLAGPNATLSSSILALGTQLVGSTSTGSTVTLSNDGTAALNITSIAATTNFGVTDNCGLSLAAGANCTITVSFTPGAIGNLTGTLSIADNAPGSPQTVSLSGAGTQVEFSPDFLGFSCMSVCAPRTVTMTNTGAMPLGISSITISSPLFGRHDAFNETNNCPASLGAGQSCAITVSFAGNQAIPYQGTLIVTDDGGGSPQTVTLHGIIL